MTLNDSGPLSCCDGIEIVTPAIIDFCSTRTHTCYTNYRNTPALKYSICNRYKHCSFCPVTLNNSGHLSCCDGIEVVTPAIIDYGTTRTHTCYSNYRNTPAVNYSICNRYKHCSFSLFTLNESGPFSCCDGIEIVTPAIINHCSTRTHTCYYLQEYSST